MIKKIFSGYINSITIAALLVAVSSLMSRLLGLFRDRILASEFGAGDTLDIYYAAFRIPDLIFNLLVLGALSAGFIPIITCLIKDHECRARTDFSVSPNKEAWTLASNVVNLLSLMLIVLSVIGIFLAPYFMKLLTPGFDPAKQAMTVALTRIMFLSPIFLGISSVLGGILQSFKRFFIYSLSPIMYNVGIIIGVLYLAPRLGAYGLAWGVVLGAFLHMIVQVPAVMALGYRYAPVIDWHGKNIRTIGVMMFPRTMSLAISQINLLVITVVASTLASGSLAIFNFANNLQSFPVGLFGISYAIAAFPTLAAVAFKREELVARFSETFRNILFFIVPATILLISLRAQITRVILGTGQFDWHDTVLTIDALGFFAISLFAQATLPLMVRVFYARHDAKTPFFVGLTSAVANVIIALYLSRRFGVAGLALAFSLVNILYFILLWIALKLEIKYLDEKRIILSVSRFTAGAVAAALTMQGAKLAVWPLINMTKFWGVLAQGLGAGIAGLAAYLIVCALLKSEEFYAFWSAVKRRWPWRKIETGDQGEARGI
jgi:putative peptidoglycan lipid II flippase